MTKHYRRMVSLTYIGHTNTVGKCGGMKLEKVDPFHQLQPIVLHVARLQHRPPTPRSGQRSGGFDSDRRSPYCPTESVTHFLVKLVFAAPASFLSPAAVSQAVAESV
jgi:hypothetical protein